jgi:ferredoxin-NADP reductase
MATPADNGTTGTGDDQLPDAVPWRVAAVVTIVEETRRVRSLVLDVPAWPGHRPGQHVEVRAGGGAGPAGARAYSIASPPEAPNVILTVERASARESPHVADAVAAGDRIDLRGPLGRDFTWTVEEGGPLLLVAGGTGIVPLMAMLRHRAARASPVPAVLLYSSQSVEDIVYRAELERLAAGPAAPVVVHTVTRQPPAAWTGLARRIDRSMLADVGFPPAERPYNFVCGPTTFVEDVSRMLGGLGHPRARIRTERFGPDGELT